MPSGSRLARFITVSFFCCLTAMLAGASPARAMCVYSHIDRKLEVDLDWKWGDHRWEIPCGEHQCTDGEGGQVSIRVRDHEDYVVMSGDDVVFDVDDHGWVSVTVLERGSNGHPTKWKFKNKDKNGKVKDSATRSFDCPWDPCPRN